MNNTMKPLRAGRVIAAILAALLAVESVAQQTPTRPGRRSPRLT